MSEDFLLYFLLFIESVFYVGDILFILFSDFNLFKSYA